jgi:hypothetical protein
VSLSEIAAVRGPLQLPVERDVFFEASKSVGAYTAEACRLREYRGLRSMAFRSRNDLPSDAPTRQSFKM